jgi:serine O-acetyltransferase
VCEGGRLLAALRADLDRYVFVIEEQGGGSGPFVTLGIALVSPGLWSTMAYRLNHYGRFGRRSFMLALATRILQRVMIWLTGTQIDPRAHIGPGLKFPHGGQIIIGPVRMGSNCDIYQGVTLGAGESTLDRRSGRADVPTLGDRVWVGPGAVVAGGVTVEDDAVVGANSLVVRDVPARGVMIGVPARMTTRRGSFAQVRYRTMESDDERKLALAEAVEAEPRSAQ